MNTSPQKVAVKLKEVVVSDRFTTRRNTWREDLLEEIVMTVALIAFSVIAALGFAGLFS